jgi:tetratricopeptide (TPR) repeat protein
MFTNALDAVAPAYLARALCGAGIAVHLLDDNPTSIRLIERAIALCEQAGDALGAARARRDLLLPLRIIGDIERFHATAALCEPVIVAAGDLFSLGWVTFLRGLVAMDTVDLAAAWEGLSAGRALFIRCGERHTADWICINLGNVARLRGDLEEAERQYQIALDTQRATNSRDSVAQIVLNQGNVARLRGDLQRARAIYREVLPELYEVGNRRRVADCFEAIGALLAVEGDAQTAAQLCAAAVALRARIGVPLSPAEAPGYEQIRRQVRAALLQEEADAAWAAGSALDLDAAYALARRALA